MFFLNAKHPVVSLRGLLRKPRQSVPADAGRFLLYEVRIILSLPGLSGQSVPCDGQIATADCVSLAMTKKNQISIMIGRIIGFFFALLNRYWLRSFLIVDLMVAQSEILRVWQVSIERVAIMRSASIRSSFSLA